MIPNELAVERAVEQQRGTALVMALMFTMVAAGIVYSGSILQRSNRTKVSTSFRMNSQALQFARAGMTEAVNWFRRQDTQPVLDFAPQRDELANPQILETEDPEVGIVRQFRIEGKVWGRYEVWREWAADPDPARLAWREAMACSEVGTKRGPRTQGAAWRIRSLGYVFEMEDPAVSFDQSPNRVIAQRILETEVIRRRLAPPGQAALSVADGNSAHVNTNGRIRGGAIGAGIYYPAGTGRPTTGPNNQQRVLGSPALAQAPSVDVSAEGVFGVSWTELRATANQIVTEERNFPPTVENNHTVVAEVASITFDRDRPLQGTGLVAIRGNVTIVAGSNSRFSGLLYVDGNLTVRAPCEIEGAVVVTGNFNIQGAGDFATITYNDDVLNALRREIGQYRFLGSYRQMFVNQ